MSELEDTKKKVNTITNLPIQNELRQIPTNLEAERALLGAILTNNRAYEHIEEIVNESDFAEPLNKEIFSYTKSLIDKGKIVADGTSEELISSAQGVKQLHLEIKNAQEDSIQDMKATISQINIKSIKKYENSFNINLEYKSGTDPREDIFNHAVSQSWVITEMRVSEKNLEDIFRNLTNTSDEGALNE